MFFVVVLWVFFFFRKIHQPLILTIPQYCCSVYASEWNNNCKRKFSFLFSELAIQPNLNSVLVPPHARNASDPGAVTGDTNPGTDGGTTQGATAATEQPVWSSSHARASLFTSKLTVMITFRWLKVYCMLSMGVSARDILLWSS